MKRIGTGAAVVAMLMAIAGPAKAQEFSYPPGGAQIFLGDVSGACPGGTVAVSGSGFADDVAVDIFFDDVLVGSTVADNAGGFSVTIETPDAAAGTHTITAVQDLPPNASPDTLVASATFTCVGAAGLAVTGGNVAMWMLLVAGLVGIGVIALVAGRRRARRAA